ncbi:unnamed protein product [Rotaria sordida]|uniref:Uncharacterized protein n=1 Tax=Rotaria sordida TaxID=392033 RepID=A0A819UD98_9BILA|nr:unnamed protein product [Rotaria sordida]
MGAGCYCCCKKQATPPPYNPDIYRTKTPSIRHKPEAVLTRNKTPLVIREPETKLPRNKSPPIIQDNSAMQRFLKPSISTTNPLKLIDGYLHEPVVSLEKALQPFDGQIDQLSYYIKEAKTKCHHPSEHNLTHDESAAIYIYTMKWDNKCVYDHLQEAWKSEDRSKMKPWFKYLRLFKSAFDKLPDAKEEIWQGTLFDERLIEKLSSKLLPLYSCMGSCLPSSNEVKDYLEKHDSTKIILIGYESVHGKSIVGNTANPWSEHILFPGTKLGVTIYNVINANGSLSIHFKALTTLVDMMKSE